MTWRDEQQSTCYWSSQRRRIPSENVEVDHATGKLKTVAGTIDLLKFQNVFAAMYDEVNVDVIMNANTVYLSGIGDETNEIFRSWLQRRRRNFKHD